MAITPSQWSHKLWIPDAYIPGANQSGIPLVVTEAVIAKMSAADQDTFWNNVQNGGGDVRFCVNEDGTSQLPIEIPSNNLDNQARTCVIWARRPYSGASGVWCFIGKAGETQPAVTDPFGRNAVWVNFAAVIDPASGVNSVDGVALSETNVTSQSTAIGPSYSFNGTNSRVDLALSGTGANQFFMQGWVVHASLTDAQPYFSVADSSVGDRQHRTQRIATGVIQASTFDGSVLNANSSYSAVNSTPFLVSSYYDGEKREIIINAGTAEIYSAADSVANVDRLTLGTTADSTPFGFFNGDLTFVTLRFFKPSDDTLETEYANQSDPATFYGTPTITTTGGGGAVEQPVVSVNAEEAHQANTLSISSFNSFSSVISEQIESATMIDVFLSQLASSIQAQENQQANTLTIEQSAGQSISLNTAQQVEQATVLSLSQQQALAHIVAEQLSAASVTDVSNLQAVTMIIAEETHQANTLNVEQYTGQFVTLITAEQKNEAQTLLISEVGAIDVLQAEQATNAETMAFSQVQRLTQITAEQLTEAQLLTILTSGDNTDLSGLRLIPVTSKFSITPITNPNTLSKV